MLLLPGKQVPETGVKRAKVSGRTERSQQLECPVYHQLMATNIHEGVFCDATLVHDGMFLCGYDWQDMEGDVKGIV